MRWIGAALAAVALVLYRRRHLEGAGDVVTVRWVRPIFKYGMAFCFALALGLFLYQFFGYNPAPRGLDAAVLHGALWSGGLFCR